MDISHTWGLRFICEILRFHIKMTCNQRVVTGGTKFNPDFVQMCSELGMLLETLNNVNNKRTERFGQSLLTIPYFDILSKTDGWVDGWMDG